MVEVTEVRRGDGTAAELWRGGTKIWPVGGLTQARFLGDPGVGKWYLGGSVDTDQYPNGTEGAWDGWNADMAAYSSGREMTIRRIFAQGSDSTGFAENLGNTIENAIGNGVLPHVSWKLPPSLTPAEAAAGGPDFQAWGTLCANRIKAVAPNVVWWTFHHEPENDSIWTGTTGMAQYRQIQRNLVEHFRDQGVTNAAFWCVGYMTPWTFQSASGRDWRGWYPDWKGTTQPGSSWDNPDPEDFWLPGSDPEAIMSGDDIGGIGHDVYHNWDEGDSLSAYQAVDWHTTEFGIADVYQGFLGQQYNIMEYGVKVYHTGFWSQGTDANYQPLLMEDYIDDTLASMQSYGIVAIQVYNSQPGSDTTKSWRLTEQDPAGYRFQKYGESLALSDHADPVALGWIEAP